jgi:hypothetical protein
MSESTREWILKRRHEDRGDQEAHPGLSFNCTLADDLRLGWLWPELLTQWSGCSQLRSDARPWPSCGFTGVSFANIELNRTRRLSRVAENSNEKLSAKLLVSPGSG